MRFNALASVRSSSSLPCWTSSGWPRWRLIEPGLVATGLLASGIPDNVWDRGEDRGPGRLFTIVNNCHVDHGQAPPNLLSAAHKSSRPMAWKMPSRVPGCTDSAYHMELERFTDMIVRLLAISFLAAWSAAHFDSRISVGAETPSRETLETDKLFANAIADRNNQWDSLLKDVGKVKEGLGLSARLSSESITVGEKLQIDLCIKNVTELPSSYGYDR